VASLDWGWRYLRWRARCALGPAVAHDGPERCTAVVLSFARPGNLAPIVSSLRRCGFVERIHVVNNHPEVRIADWVRARDPRLRLSDAGRARPPLTRFEVARDDGAAFLALLDDDVFLSPAQVLALFRRLVAEPAAPHGFYGQRFVRPEASGHAEAFENRVHGVEAEVDVLNRAYFASREHVDRAWRLHDRARAEHPDLCLDFVDDILLSVASPARPRVHDVGPFLDCPSQGDRRISVWARAGAGSHRLDAMRRLVALAGVGDGRQGGAQSRSDR
jgi:hypothetical protein